MTAAASFPDPRDPEAVRRWMRENQRSRADRPAPRTPRELAASQHRRLLDRLGPPDEPRPSRRRLDVALTGDSTHQHTVRLDVLGPFLDGLQSSVTSIAQALGGRPTTHAPIPQAIREATALSAAATFPSSFGVVLYGPEWPTTDDWVGGDEERESLHLLDEAVGTVLNVSDLSKEAEQDDSSLNEELIPLGARALKHMGKLTKVLTDKHVGLRMTWHAQNGRTRLSELSPASASRIQYVCEHSSYSEAEIVTVAGWLGSASAIHANAEIRTDSGELIRAKTDEPVTRRLGEYFGNRVEARVEVTTVHYAGGRERKIYTVLSLRNT
ncbi:hypothetical protein [Streptomyces sp. 5-6(2022)]|uniref:hypothetical protein n=1 Tax=Streptomyces sp. 5-6(2022) TaxID=2936510 RepID=UPI0023B99E34|nr:hypothetical protein [Streptomyces sp. 5-6(2022)]